MSEKYVVVDNEEIFFDTEADTREEAIIIFVNEHQDIIEDWLDANDFEEVDAPEGGPCVVVKDGVVSCLTTGLLTKPEIFIDGDSVVNFVQNYHYDEYGLDDGLFENEPTAIQLDNLAELVTEVFKNWVQKYNLNINVYITKKEQDHDIIYNQKKDKWELKENIN